MIYKNKVFLNMQCDICNIIIFSTLSNMFLSTNNHLDVGKCKECIWKICVLLWNTHICSSSHALQSDAFATFLWCKYCSVYIPCICHLLKLKIILIEKQHRFCEIVTYAQWLQFSLHSYWTITAWSLISDSQTRKWNILPPTLWFPEAVLFHDLKDQSLNTDVKHFYKISPFLIQK
jgi:hypothetical protein